MNVKTIPITGAIQILGPEGSTPVRAIVLPLLSPQGAWVVTGTIQAVRGDDLEGAVTFFPRFAGTCAKGLATLNNTGELQTEPVDGGKDQGFHPKGPALVGADQEGIQVEIALTGEEAVPIFWAWDLKVTIFATPAPSPGSGPRSPVAELRK